MSTPGAADGGAGLVEWGVERASELLDLVDAGYPDDRLTLDEIETACWAEDGAGSNERMVLGRPDGSAAIALRTDAGRTTVLAASSQSAFGGLVSDAVAAAHDHGSTEVVIGGSVPDGLWPGISSPPPTLVAALTSRGFEPLEDVTIASVPTTFRADPPPGTTVLRVIDTEGATRLRHWLATQAPGCEAVVERAIDQATCLAAIDDEVATVGGVVAHSVGRDGWIGPVLVAGSCRRNGIGSALVAAAARDLMVAGFDAAPLAWHASQEADPAWDWPPSFLRAIDARPWRSYRRWRLDLV